MDAVDEKVDINSKYSDELYNTFIEEGLKIHKKYEAKWNLNNDKLLKHDDSCKN